MNGSSDAMENKATEFKVGLISIVGILILVLGIMWGKDVRVGTSYQRLQCIFTNSGGLRPGDPVTVNGVKKGRVESVKLQGNRVLVTALLSPDVVLYTDAKCRIAMVDLMGANKLEIYPGDSGVQLDLSDHPAPLTGTDVISIEQMMADLVELKNKVEHLLNQAQTSIAALNRIMDEQNTIQPLQSSIRHLSGAAQKVHALIEEEDVTLRKAFANLQQSSQMFYQLMETHSNDLETTLKELPILMKRLNAFSQTLEELSQKMNNREGSLAKFLYDDSTYIRTQRVLMRWDSLTTDLKHQLGTFLQGTDIKLFNLIDF